MIIDSIFNYLLADDKFYNVVYPHLDVRLFSDTKAKTLFGQIKKYSDTYSKHPKPADLKLLLSTNPDITQEKTTEVSDYIDTLTKMEVTKNPDLMIDEAETWVKDRCMELAILDSVEILQNGEPRGLIEEKIKEALAVSFRNELGLHYLADAEQQYEFYTNEEMGIPVDIPSINKAVGRGFRKKSIYMFIGKTHVGKTLWLCHIAAAFKRSDISGVYFTAEMSENAITHRIDANILDFEMSELGMSLGRESYMDKVSSTIEKYSKGDWFIKEYPPGFASKNNITSYLQELKIKEGIIPDVIIVDYINLFASSRLPASAMQNSYLYMKVVTEEMRALAVENAFPVITATQTNRDSANNSIESADMTGVGESWAMPQTSDWMGIIAQPPELFEERKYLLKVLKNRHADNMYDVCTVGVDRTHMRLLELTGNEQDLPIVVKDRMAVADKKRDALPDDDERTFIFEEDV